MHSICTIVASNYLAQASVLIDSIRKIYSDIDVSVLVIDGVIEDSKYLDKARLILPRDLNIPSKWLSEMRGYYDATELSTSLKPFLLRYLLEDGADTVTYLDPDILLFSDIQEGIEAASVSGIALTPHRLTPAPLTILEKTEINFLKFGTFNLGYISVGVKGLPMLNWWCDRLRFFCTKFPGYDVFTDQKWINLVPAYFEHKVLKNGGYNVASWNLDERALRFIDDILYAGDNRVAFIHFAQMSGRLSKGLVVKTWEDSILDSGSESRQSLDIIEGITATYSTKLMEQHRRAENLSLSKNREKISNLSYHKKRLAIRDAMGTRNRKFIFGLRYKRPFKSSVGNQLSLFLERSSALNGLRDGLKTDFIKIIAKIGKFFW